MSATPCESHSFSRRIRALPGSIIPAWRPVRITALGQQYLPKGASGILTFGVKTASGTAADRQRAGERLIESCTFMSHLANIGDARTLIIHPASTTHRQLSEQELLAAGVGPDLIRLSVGLESADDIIWDLDQALGAVSVD